MAGEGVSPEEAAWLAGYPDLDALCDAADAISRHWQGSEVDSCSIINARSGMCGEDCKWCAQASRHHTGCDTYGIISRPEAMKAAKANSEAGIRRFSLVTSGRTVAAKDLGAFCDIIRDIKAETGLYLCASMGLLDRKGMEMLRDAGVSRYH